MFRIIRSNSAAQPQKKKTECYTTSDLRRRKHYEEIFLAISPELLNKHAQRRAKRTRRSSVWKPFVSPEKFSITLKFMTLFCFHVRKRISRLDFFLLLLRSKLMWSIVSFSFAVFFSAIESRVFNFKLFTWTGWKDSVIISILFDWMTFCLCVWFYFIFKETSNTWNDSERKW